MFCRSVLRALNAINARSNVSNLIKTSSPALTSSRSLIIVNNDWKAGPYPKTPEERRAAAKKYNLPEEWYEPYEDNGNGYGDYPKLPKMSTEGRDIDYPWDYPEFRRNFDEPIHIDEMMMNDTRYNFQEPWPVPYNTVVLMFFTWMFTTFAIYVFMDDYDLQMTRPVLEKSMPASGKPSYAI